MSPSNNSTPSVQPSAGKVDLSNLAVGKPSDLIKMRIGSLLFKNVIRLMSMLIISVPYDKSYDEFGENAKDIFSFIERKNGIIENFEILLKNIFPEQKYVSEKKQINADDCIIQQKDFMEKNKDNKKYTSEDIKKNISIYFNNIISKFGDGNKGETRENINEIIEKLHNCYESEKTKTQQEENIIQSIFDNFNFKIDENLDQDLIGVLDQIDCYPIQLYQGITGFNQLNLKTKQFYELKLSKYKSDTYNDSTEFFFEYLKVAMQDITTEEDKKIKEKPEIEQLFSKIGIDFELNSNFLLSFKILKCNLFTFILGYFYRKNE